MMIIAFNSLNIIFTMCWAEKSSFYSQNNIKQGQGIVLFACDRMVPFYTCMQFVMNQVFCVQLQQVNQCPLFVQLCLFNRLVRALQYHLQIAQNKLHNNGIWLLVVLSVMYIISSSICCVAVVMLVKGFHPSLSNFNWHFCIVSQ